MFKLEDIYGSCIRIANHQSSVMEQDTRHPFHVFSIIEHETTILVHVICISFHRGYESFNGGYCSSAQSSIIWV